MRLSRDYLMIESESSGFRPEIMEKAIHLLSLLQILQSHPALKNKFALKGGTALNLFWFDVPRLSVDIDLNYVGEVDRELMDIDKSIIDQAIDAVCSREGYVIIRKPDDHAGGKYTLRYESVITPTAILQLDLNFMYRVPLWSINLMNSYPVGRYTCTDIPVVDIHEIAAGKLTALLSRNASRDLYDTYRLFNEKMLDIEKLRIAFVIYGAINRKDWRKVRIDDLNFRINDLEDQLLPVLRDTTILEIEDRPKWTQYLLDSCREYLKSVMPLRQNEIEFLDWLNDSGDIKFELLTDDPDLRYRISIHPGILWKALNVKKFRS